MLNNIPKAKVCDARDGYSSNAARLKNVLIPIKKQVRKINSPPLFATIFFSYKNRFKDFPEKTAY